MFQDTVVNIINDIWPMILIIVVILVSLRITDIIINKKKIVLYNDLLILLFIVYILCLFHVVTFQDVNFGNSNFIPFKEMFRYEFLSRLFIKNVMGNVLLFVPYGFFSCYILKTRKFYVPFILLIVASVTIETVQYYIGRVFDIDDIILNIVGGIIGYIIYVILDKINNNLPKIFKKELFLNIVLIFGIIIALIYSFKLKLF